MTEIFESIKEQGKKKGVIKFSLEFRQTGLPGQNDNWIAVFKTRKSLYSAASRDPLNAITQAISQITKRAEVNHGEV